VGEALIADGPMTPERLIDTRRDKLTSQMARLLLLLMPLQLRMAQASVASKTCLNSISSVVGLQVLLSRVWAKLQTVAAVVGLLRC